jgi:hypothetical protein
MRRVPVAILAVLLLAGTGAASYEVGARSERQSRSSSACHEAVGLQKQLEDRASTLVAAIPPLETSHNGFQDNSADRSRAADQARPVISEMGMLVSQNPTCFTPTLRAQVAALDRQWNSSVL